MSSWMPLGNSHLNQLKINDQFLQNSVPEMNLMIEHWQKLDSDMEIWEENQQIRGVRFTNKHKSLVLLDPTAAEDLLQKQKSSILSTLQQGTLCVVLAGIGAGHAVWEGWLAIKNQPRVTLLCIDPIPQAWLSLAALFDLTEMVGNKRVFFFGGENAWHEAAHFIEKQYLYLLGSQEMRLVLGAIPTESLHIEGYIQSARNLFKQSQAYLPRFETRLAQFAEVMKKPLPSSPQTIWGCIHANSYIHNPIAKAVLHGFQQNGLETKLGEFTSSIAVQSQILGELIDTSPDLIFTINAWPNALLEDIGLQSTLVSTIHRPRLCWLVDDTTLYESQKENFPISPDDWYFCCDRTYLTWLRRYTPRALFLPVATMFDRPGQYREGFAAPISYIGSLPAVQEYLESLPFSCQEMLEQLNIMKARNHSLSYRDLLASLLPNPNQRQFINSAAEKFTATTKKGFTTQEGMLEYFLYNIVTYMKRKQIVTALLPLGLKVFGPDSWLSVLPSKYKHCYGGFVAHADLADAYRSAQLSLNIHSHQCPTCLNPRDFDVPMAGGLVLGDYVEDADRGLIKPGEEMLVFHTEEEMLDLVQQALKNPDRSKQMGEQAQQTVKEKHTYNHRAKTILQWLQSPPTDQLP